MYHDEALCAYKVVQKLAHTPTHKAIHTHTHTHNTQIATPTQDTLVVAHTHTHTYTRGYVINNKFKLTEPIRSLELKHTHFQSDYFAGLDNTIDEDFESEFGDHEGQQNVMLASGIESLLEVQHTQKRYGFKSRLGKGSFGEVWRAIHLSEGSPYKSVVLKRLFTEKDTYVNDEIRQSGNREIFFGKLLKGAVCISRFIEAFEEKAPDGDHNNPPLWLAFADEGRTLKSYLLQPDLMNGIIIPSPFWWSTKHSQNTFVREVTRRILMGLAHAHWQRITHRDIKMENIFVSSINPVNLCIGDWGSAIKLSPKGDDDYMGHVLESSHLYGSGGPSIYEETDGYQPPEAFDTHTNTHGDTHGDTHTHTHTHSDKHTNRDTHTHTHTHYRLPSYDMWSLGVVLLQMVAGRPDVLTLASERRKAKVLESLKNEDENTKAKYTFLMSLEEWGLLPADVFEPRVFAKPKATEYAHFAVANKAPADLEGLAHTHIRPHTHTQMRSYTRTQNTHTHTHLSLPLAPIHTDILALAFTHTGFPTHTHTGPHTHTHTHTHTQSPCTLTHAPHTNHRALPEEEAASDDMFEVFRRFQPNHRPGVSPAVFAARVAKADVSGEGISSDSLLDFFIRIFSYYPHERITAAEALRHPWILEGQT